MNDDSAMDGKENEELFFIVVVPRENLKPVSAAFHLLHKIGKELSFEVEHNRMTLRALNDLKSAFCAVEFPESFFDQFQLGGANTQPNGLNPPGPSPACFSGRLAVKQICGIFRNVKQVQNLRISARRIGCDHELVFSMSHSNGSSRTHRFKYFDCEIVNAVFGHGPDCSLLRAKPKVLAQLVEHIYLSHEVAVEATPLKFFLRSYHKPVLSGIDGAVGFGGRAKGVAGGRGAESNIYGSSQRILSTGLNVNIDELDIYDFRSTSEPQVESFILCMKEMVGLFGFCVALDLPDIDLYFTKGGSALKLSSAHPDLYTAELILATIELPPTERTQQQPVAPQQPQRATTARHDSAKSNRSSARDTVEEGQPDRRGGYNSGTAGAMSNESGSESSNRHQPTGSVGNYVHNGEEELNADFDREDTLAQFRDPNPSRERSDLGENTPPDVKRKRERDSILSEFGDRSMMVAQEVYTDNYVDANLRQSARAFDSVSMISSSKVAVTCSNSGSSSSSSSSSGNSRRSEGIRETSFAAYEEEGEEEEDESAFMDKSCAVRLQQLQPLHQQQGASALGAKKSSDNRTYRDAGSSSNNDNKKNAGAESPGHRNQSGAGVDVGLEVGRNEDEEDGDEEEEDEGMVALLRRKRRKNQTEFAQQVVPSPLRLSSAALRTEAETETCETDMAVCFGADRVTMLEADVIMNEENVRATDRTMRLERFYRLEDPDQSMDGAFRGFDGTGGRERNSSVEGREQRLDEQGCRDKRQEIVGQHLSSSQALSARSDPSLPASGMSGVSGASGASGMSAVTAAAVRALTHMCDGSVSGFVSSSATSASSGVSGASGNSGINSDGRGGRGDRCGDRAVPRIRAPLTALHDSAVNVSRGDPSESRSGAERDDAAYIKPASRSGNRRRTSSSRQ